MEIEEVSDLCHLISEDQEVVLPLYHVDTLITITDNIAKIEFKQYYFNKHEEPVELEFVAPIHSSTVFSEFELKVGS